MEVGEELVISMRPLPVPAMTVFASCIDWPPHACFRLHPTTVQLLNMYVLPYSLEAHSLLGCLPWTASAGHCTASATPSVLQSSSHSACTGCWQS